jgi:Lon protease-like protein
VQGAQVKHTLHRADATWFLQDVEFIARNLGSALPEANVTFMEEDSPDIDILGGSWIGQDPLTPRGMRLKSLCTGARNDIQIDEIPLFPISTVLLPGSELPVQIFPEKSETQAMFKGLKDGGQVGVVLADYDQLGGSFARVGCQARVTDLTELEDGRLIVETAGVRRFRILAISRWRPHIVAVVRYLEDAPASEEAAAAGGSALLADGEDVGAVEQECWQALQALACTYPLARLVFSSDPPPRRCSLSVGSCASAASAFSAFTRPSTASAHSSHTSSRPACTRLPRVYRWIWHALRLAGLPLRVSGLALFALP